LKVPENTLSNLSKPTNERQENSALPIGVPALAHKGTPTCRNICSPCSKHIQYMQKETTPGWSTTHVHQEHSWPKQETAILGGVTTAEFDGDTVPRVK
jgi:hypothetical protein